MESEQLYNDYGKTVYRFLLNLCRNHDTAEELTQDTFYQAIKSIGRYNGKCSLSVWLCQIAKHLWYRELERRNKHKHCELDDYIPDSDTERELFGSEDKLRLFRHIHKLDEISKEVVFLRLSGEFSFKDIGEVLGESENFARVRFYRAKQEIMKGFDEDEV